MEYSKITSISSVKNEDIYHLSVQNNHNFFGNDILLHNCDYPKETFILLFNSSASESFKIEDENAA